MTMPKENWYFRNWTFWLGSLLWWPATKLFMALTCQKHLPEIYRPRWPTLSTEAFIVWPGLWLSHGSSLLAAEAMEVKTSRMRHTPYYQEVLHSISTGAIFFFSSIFSVVCPNKLAFLGPKMLLFLFIKECLEVQHEAKKPYMSSICKAVSSWAHRCGN